MQNEKIRCTQPKIVNIIKSSNHVHKCLCVLYLRLHSESAQSFLLESLGICLPPSENGSKSQTERISQSLQGMSALCGRTRWYNGGNFWTFLSACPPRERRFNDGVPLFSLTLPPPYLMQEHAHRAPFRLLKQVNRMGAKKSRRVILDRPLFVSWPPLRLQCQTCQQTHSSELISVFSTSFSH